MKLGLLILLWVSLFPLFSQNCEEVTIPPVRYIEHSVQGRSREVSTYFVPCSESKTLSYSIPTLSSTTYVDPEPSTPAGIILVMLTANPGQTILTIQEFENSLYRDLDGDPLFFSDSSRDIVVSDLLNLGNVNNEFVLMPVLLSDTSGNDAMSWFENGCVHIFPEYSLTLVENPDQNFEFTHFDEITFTNWPADTMISDYFDFSFTDKESGEEIPFTVIGNRTLKLEFPRSNGIFNYVMTWKDLDCQIVGIGDNWDFPTVGVRIDTVSGFQNIEKCVPVRAFNFESVTGFELWLTWNGDTLDFSHISHIHPALAPFMSMGDVAVSGGHYEIRLELPAGLDTITLPDSAILFEFCGRPLVRAGETVRINMKKKSSLPGSHFRIYGLETESVYHPGGIAIQEDREIIYDLHQLCTAGDGKRPIRLDVVNDEAYPYSYSFHSELLPDTTVTSVPILIPDAPPGTYEFTIRDSFGFEITDSFTVRENVPPDFQLSVDPDLVIHPTCLQPFGGQIGVSIWPEDGNFQISLLNDASSFRGDSVSGLVAGTYMIQAKDAEGCTDTVRYTLQNPKEINISWDKSSLVLCPDANDVAFRIVDMSPIPDPSIEYLIEGWPVMGMEDSIHITGAGSYPLQVWNGDGCTLDTLVEVRAGPEEMTIWDTTALLVQRGDTLNFNSPGPPGLTQTTWDFDGATIGDRTAISFMPQESGILTFRASVYDRCVYTDSLMIKVIHPDLNSLEFEFPNVFTPNSDGVNDIYYVMPPPDIQNVNSVQIFDRYGSIVYDQEFQSGEEFNHTGWDGRADGMDAPAGVYGVQVFIELANGQGKAVGYDILLMR